MISSAVKHSEVRSSSSMEGRLQKKKTSRAELMWWLSFIWVITDQLLQHAVEDTALWWVGAAAQTSRSHQHLRPPALRTEGVLAHRPGSLAAAVIASSQPLLEQKGQADVISPISHLTLPCCFAVFNDYGHAVLGDGFPQHLVCKHVNDAGTD